MTRTKSQILSPVGILTAIGANISGIVTAFGFIGNLIGSINSSGVSTVSNLQSTNINATGIVTSNTFVGQLNSSGVSTVSNLRSTNINVTGIVTANTFVGQLNSSGVSTVSNLQSTNINATGISTIKTLIPTEIRFITGSEKVTIINGNTVNLVYNSNSSNIGVCTNPSGNITLNVTGIPESSDFNNSSITFAVFSNATGIAYSCLTVNLNNLSKTIKWIGGSSQSATAGVTTVTGYTLYSFTGINTVGSASTMVNYQVFGQVSGGFW
jgi:hypothetical protein